VPASTCRARRAKDFLAKLTAWNPPDATLDVECSKGTYPHACRRPGRRAWMRRASAALRREGTGGFSIGDAVADALEAQR
jgi:tRNA U55 pseudouridine synthase TruB